MTNDYVSIGYFAWLQKEKCWDNMAYVNCYKTLHTSLSFVGYYVCHEYFEENNKWNTMYLSIV